MPLLLPFLFYGCPPPPPPPPIDTRRRCVKRRGPVRRASLLWCSQSRSLNGKKAPWEALKSVCIHTAHCAVEKSIAVLLYPHTRDQRDLIQYLFPFLSFLVRSSSATSNLGEGLPMLIAFARSPPPSSPSPSFPTQHTQEKRDHGQRNTSLSFRVSFFLSP